jgi:ketosteroid isomerase-like protein
MRLHNKEEGEKHMKARIVTTLVAALLAATLTSIPALAADKSDMAGRATGWEKAFNSGNGEAVAAFYTEDAQRLPYQAPTVSGNSAIAANVQTTYEAGAVKIKLAVLGAESQGSMGWGHGTYELMDADGKTVQKGKWMNISKKVGGKWLIHADIWNTNAPE